MALRSEKVHREAFLLLSLISGLLGNRFLRAIANSVSFFFGKKSGEKTMPPPYLLAVGPNIGAQARMSFPSSMILTEADAKGESLILHNTFIEA